MQNLLTLILSIALFPITLLGSWLVVRPQEEYVLLRWGGFRRVIATPGLHFVVLWGRQLMQVTTKQQAIELHKTTVADANGNPIIMAGICTYRVVDAAKAMLQVQNCWEFVRAQAMAVIKQIASQYPYESPDGHSLKVEAGKIAGEMVALLQGKVAPAGMQVLSFEMSDLSYAPEIASQMLVRQQAQALISARKLVVEGAVEIVADAITRLGEKNIAVRPEAQQRLVSNLLVVICGDAKITPTFAIEDEENSDNFELLTAIKDSLDHIRANTAGKKTG